MTTDFKLTPHADYLHVALAPGYEIYPAGVTELVKSVSDVCARQGQRRVLIEGKVAARRMAAMDSFAVGALAGSMLAGVSLACCFYGYKCGWNSSASATTRCAGWGCGGGSRSSRSIASFATSSQL